MLVNNAAARLTVSVCLRMYRMYTCCLCLCVSLARGDCARLCDALRQTCLGNPFLSLTHTRRCATRRRA
jgi:hypothetical protein